MRMCLFKSCQPESNRGKECSGALTKPDAPAYSPLHTCSLLPSLVPQASYLTPQMERGVVQQTPSSACLKYTVFLIDYLLTLFGSRLPVCVPISLSSCLLLSTFLSLCLADLFFNPSSTPTILRHSMDTHTHTGNTNMGLFHSLLYILFSEHCQYSH